MAMKVGTTLIGFRRRYLMVSLLLRPMSFQMHLPGMRRSKNLSSPIPQMLGFGDALDATLLNALGETQAGVAESVEAWTSTELIALSRR